MITFVFHITFSTLVLFVTYERIRVSVIQVQQHFTCWGFDKNR